MAEYKYVDWPGLQYYHGKVTELIDSRLRQCIRFGGDTLYVDLDSPDTNDLNIVIRVLDSFTVRPSDDWFDETLWNNTYPAGTLLQVVQKPSGVVYTVFIQPVTNQGGGGSDTPIDLSNYYTIAEVDAKIVEALKPYATVEFVTVKLDAIQSLLAAHIDEFGKLTTRVTELENTLTTQITPAIEQLEESITTLAETKADVKDIPSLEGYATKEFVAAAINAIEIPVADLSEYAKIEDVENQIAGVQAELDTKADADSLKGLASESYVDEKFASIEHPDIPTKVSELENDVGYITEHQDISGKADVEHTHSISDITDYEAPDLSEYAKKEDIPEVNLSNFYNKTEVENIVNEAVGNISVPEVPTNVSAFVNDAGYITEHQDLSEYAKLTDIPNTDDFATEDFVKQKIIEAQLSGDGEPVDLSIFYTKDEIDSMKFATEEYVQRQLDEADVIGIDSRLTVIENKTETIETRTNAVEDQSEANEAAIAALSGEIDRVDETLLTMETQVVKISQNLADLQTYGTF